MTALLDATAQILSEHTGIEAPQQEISKRANVNSAMIRYYFGSKEGLLVALLERDADAAMSALNHLVAMDMPADRKLKIHIEGIINAYYRSPYLNRLIHYLMESGNSSNADRVTEVFVKPMLTAYRAIIDQGTAEGTLIEVEPELLYHALVGASEHLFYASDSLARGRGRSGIDEDLKRRYFLLVSRVFIVGLQPGKEPG